LRRSGTTERDSANTKAVDRTRIMTHGLDGAQSNKGVKAERSKGLRSMV
jgi:hypothetical protein